MGACHSFENVRLVKSNTISHADEDEARTSTPLSMTSSPSSGTSVPLSETSMPLSGTSVPLSKTSMPTSVKENHTFEEVSEYIRTQYDVLAEMESYDNAECLQIMRNIIKIWMRCVSHRQEIGDLMVQLMYPELLIKMLKSFDFIGKLEDYHYLKIIVVIQNYAEVSPKFCQELISHGVVDLISANISHESYLENQSDKRVRDILSTSLSILHNVAMNVKDLPEFREAFEKNQIKEILHSHYLSSEDDDCRCLATMIICDIITEEENKMLDATGAIEFIMTELKKAINGKDRRSPNLYCVAELGECLEHMAHNDNNKIEIVKHGALPALVNMMRYKDIKENALAANIVWILCFDVKIRAQIKAEPGLMDALKKLKKSPDQKTSKSAKGALWTIKEHHKVAAPAASDTKGNHVFISYDWGNQDMIKQLNSALKQAGYRTWVDIEHMGGSTLESMAKAVERAAVILVCGSERYKQSPNCRAEAEYTFQLKKEIVPLLLQRKYKPDGWLGMLFGAKLFINFDGKYEFDVAFQKLLEELHGRGRDDIDEPDGPELIQATTASLVAAAPGSVKPDFTKWSEKQVEKFFDEADLKSVKSRFKGYNGKKLAGLRSMKQTAPDFFYKRLETEYKFSMDDFVTLTAALDEL